MIATNFGSRILALAAAGAALVGCDSIQDVRDEPSTALPAQTVVLKGSVTGVGSLRGVVLTRNGQLSGSVAVAAPPPTESNESLNGVTPFTFGTFPAGTPYDVTIYENPRGKICTVNSGSTGVLTAGVETDIQVSCVNTGTRYSMTVNVNPAFVSAEGAQVVLTTEDGIFRAIPAPGATTVTFTDVLFNPNPAPADPLIRGFVWNVAATTSVGGTLNKCPVTNATNVVGATITNPTANITNVTVGACSFTIGGTVAYSPPISGAPVPPPPAGLVLELRDLVENTVRTQAFTGAWGSTFSFSEGGNPVQFVSNRNAIYSVAVGAHPAGMRCVVVNPMAILFAPTLTSNPTNVSAPSVQCRELPTPDRQLRGVYRHATTIWQRSVSGATPVVESTYDALDFSRQNTASSNMMAFYENGTFIYGTHANASQIEHGFYDYNPVAGTLRFTLNADTNTSVAFPAGFSSANANSPAAVPTTTPGMSSVPGTTVVNRVALYAQMNGVNTATAGRISGTFSGCQYYAAFPAPPAAIPACASTDATATWVLEAPPSVPNQMTGAWLAQDGRRLWVFDRETYYGTHVGVVGVYAMNDACFTMPDVSVSSGIYTRRPSIGGCYPWPRAATGQTPPYLLSGFVESIDLKVPQFMPATGGAGAVDIGTLPTYMARIPGGAQAVDGRSPSPIYFHIAPPAQFYAEAPALYFPEASTDWCTTEILGIRATLNAVPIHKPVYFCRFVP